MVLPYPQSFCVSFSPDGNSLAIASADGTACLWDLQDKKKPSIKPSIIFEGHQGWVYSVSFSPDGKFLATGSKDGTARLWDLQGRQLAGFKRQSGVYSVSFSPDGNSLAIASADGTVKLWQIEKKLTRLLTKGCNWIEDYLATHSKEREYLRVCHTKSLYK